MLVIEGLKVGGDCRGVGLRKAGKREGAWDELARGGVGGRRRLVWVERTAVVFWGAELVSKGVRSAW